MILMLSPIHWRHNNKQDGEMELDKYAPKLAAFSIGHPSWFAPTRVDAPELLDMGKGSPQDVRASLADLERMNRYLGGVSAVTRHLYPRLTALAGTAAVLDIGTGSAGLPRAIIHWAQRRRPGTHVIGLDLAARHLKLAQNYSLQLPRLTLLQADAHDLPFRANSIDYIISSLFLHHFPPEQAVKLLHHTFTLARCGIIISDLVRGWLPLIAFKLGQPIFARSYITRYDGAVSVRRGYTPSELESLARAAGIPNPRVYRSWAWRMTLVADK